MTRHELIEKVAEESRVPKYNVKLVVLSMLDCIAESLADNEPVKLSGFGIFEPVEKKERMGNNPHTGERVAIPAKRAVKFKVGAALKKTVEGN